MVVGENCYLYYSARFISRRSDELNSDAVGRMSND